MGGRQLQLWGKPGPGDRLNPHPFKLRYPLLATVNAALFLPPLLIYLIYFRRDEFVYDLAYALVAKWALIALTAVSAIAWGIAFIMRAWKRRGFGSSRSYRLTSRAITGLAVITVSFIITLLIAEFLSPIYLPAFNELSGLQQVEDDPELLYTLKPNSRHSYRVIGTGEHITYEINSLGFRGPEFPREKEPGVIRILAIGDSMTFGLDANIADGYVAQLESRLNAAAPDRRFEVINGGVSGYNTWNEVNFLARRGLALAPDIVVFQFCFNDTGDPISLISSVSYFHFKSLPDGLFPSPDMLRSNEETILTINRQTMSLRAALLFTLRKHSRLFGYFNRAWAGWQASRAMQPAAPTAEPDSAPQPRSFFHDAVASLADTSTPEFAWLRSNFARLKSLSDEHNLPVIVLVPPINLQIAGTNDAYNAAYDNVVALAREQGFAVCAPLDALRRRANGNPGQLFIGSDEVHFNKMGNEIIAEELRKEIEQILKNSNLTQ